MVAPAWATWPHCAPLQVNSQAAPAAHLWVQDPPLHVA